MSSNETDWLGATLGDWSNPTDWSNGVPDNTGSLAVLGGETAYTVTIGAGENFDVGTVTLDNYGATLDIGGVLDTDAGLTIDDGRVEVTGSLIGPVSVTFRGELDYVGAATATLQTNLTLAGGNVYWESDEDGVAGTVDAVIAAGVTIGGYGYLNGNGIDTATLTNDGTIAASGAAELFSVAVGSFVNDGLITGGTNADLYLEFNGGTAWINNGTIISDGAITRIGGQFDNAGLISVTGGQLEIGNQFFTYDQSGDYITGNTGFINTGSVIGTNTTVLLDADVTVADIGRVVLTGSTLELLGGTLDNTGGTLDASDTSLLGLELAGGTIEGGAIDIAGLGLSVTYGNSDLDNVALIGALTANAGAVLLTGSSAIYADASRTTSGEIIIGYQGRIGFAGSGPFTFDNQAVLQGGFLTWQVPIENSPTTVAVTIDAAAVITGYGQVSDGYNLTTDAVVNLGTVIADDGYQNLIFGFGTLTNQGLLEAEDNAVLTIGKREYAINPVTETEYSFDPTFLNSGTILANGGSVVVIGDEGIAELGTVIVENGGLLLFDGTLENAGGTLDASTAGLIGMQLDGGTIEGGTLDAAALQLGFVQDTDSVLDNVTVVGNLSIAGNVTLTGTTAVYADAAATTPGTITEFDAQVLIEGSASQTLSNTVSLLLGDVGWDDDGSGIVDVTVAASVAISGSGVVFDQAYYGQSAEFGTNLGTIMATGFDDRLDIDPAGFTNSGVVIAGSAAILMIDSPDFTNLSNGTLTGGTYVAESESSLIVDDGTGNPANVTTDAADLVLTGNAAFTTIEQTMTAVAAGGTLEVDDNATYGVAAVLDNAGLVTLGGGTLAAVGVDLSAGGTIVGYGAVTALQGITLGSTPIVAAGGALTLDGPLIGTAGLEIAAFATLALFGAETQSISMGLDSTLVLGGDGTLAGGTIGGFAAGDALVIDGFEGDVANFAGNMLTISNSTSSLTYAVTGSFALDAFSASVPVNNETLVQLDQAATLSVAATSPVLDDPDEVISISDALVQDATGATLTVTVTDLHGLLAAYPRDGGVAQGNGTGTLALSGNLAAVDDELQTLQYEAPGVGTPTDTIAITATDQTGASATALVDVVIDQPPTIATPDKFFLEPSVAGTLGGISISDPDAVLSAGYTITLSDLAGTLSVPATAAGVIGNDSNSLTLTGSFDAVNTALAGLGESLSTNDTLTITANDGVGGHATAVVPVYADVAPVLQGPGTIIDDVGYPVAVGLTLTDPYGAAAGDAFSVTLQVAGGTLTIPNPGSATVDGSGSGSVTIGGSLADVAAVLASFDYDWSSTGADTLTVTVDDGHGASIGDAIPIDSIADVAPTLTVPATAIVAAESPTSLGTLEIADSDAVAVGKTLTVTITDITGTLGAAYYTGVAGSGSQQLVFTGDLAQIEGDLASVSYSGAVPGSAVDATAGDTVVVSADDGRGGTATQDIAVTVDQVAYAPPTVRVSAGATLVAGEAGLLTGIAVSDPYAAATLGTLSVSVTDLSGFLSASVVGNGVVFGDGSNQLLLIGTLADVNAELASLSYTGQSAATDSDTSGDTVTVLAGDSRQGSGSASEGLTVDQTALYGGFELALATYLADQQNGADAPQLAADELATYVEGVAGAIGTAGGGGWQQGYVTASQLATAAQAAEAAGGATLLAAGLSFFEAVVAGAGGAVAVDAGVAALAQIQAAAAALGNGIAQGAAGASLQADLSALYGTLAAAAGGTITDPAWQAAYQGSLPAETTLAGDLAAAAPPPQILADAAALFDSVLANTIGATLGSADQQGYGASSQTIPTLGSDFASGASATQVQGDLAGLFNTVVTEALGAGLPGNTQAQSLHEADATITAGEAAYSGGYGVAETLLSTAATDGPTADLTGSERGVLITSLIPQIGSLDGPAAIPAAETLTGLASTLETSLSAGNPPVASVAAMGSLALGAILGAQGDAAWQQYTLDYLQAAGTLADETEGETGYDTAAIGTFYNSLIDDTLDIAADRSTGSDTAILAALGDLSSSDSNTILAGAGTLFSALVQTGGGSGIVTQATDDRTAEAQVTPQQAMNWFGDNLGDVQGAVISAALYYAQAYETTAPLAALGPAYGYIATGILIFTTVDLYAKSLPPDNDFRKNWNSFKKNPLFVIGQGLNGIGKKIAHSFGDVHLTTYDGLYFNFQAAGEFVLTRSTAPDDLFQVQVRLQPWNGSTTVTVATQAGATVGQGNLTIDAFRPDAVELNGQAVALTTGVAIDVGGATLTQLSPSSWELDYATGESVTISKSGSGASTYLNIDPSIPASLSGQMAGLLGNANGTAQNDLTANGMVLTAPLSSAELYTTFADAWRVSQESSILAYGPGQTTLTFTDESFPSEYVSLTGLPANVLANAANLVGAAGITDPGAAQGALQDYLLTGDPDFISSDAAAGTTLATTLLQPDVAQGATVAALGVASTVPTITEQASGVTDVAFTVFTTAPGTIDQTATYAVVAPDPSYLDASDFAGDVLPTGTVTIAAGQTVATVSLEVTGSLGELPSARVDLALSSGDTPVAAPSAIATVINALPVTGSPAQPMLLDPSQTGVFSKSGGTYSLDLGTILPGSTISDFSLDLVNQADSSADLLTGKFSQQGSPVVMFPNGLPDVTGLGGGQVDALSVGIDTALPGPVSSIVTFDAAETNPSGFTGSLTPITLAITGDIMPCYAAGTQIATATGEVPVERLAAGMTVVTASGGLRPVRWLGSRVVACDRHPQPERVWPVRIAADAFAPGQPGRALLLSPDHAVFVDGVLIPIKHLINGRSIAQVPTDRIEYWHVELDRHDVLLAEGLPAESFLDTGNRSAFGDGVVALHPDFSTRSWADACAELVQEGPRLVAVKRRLFRRGGQVAAPPAGLRVLAEGRSLVAKRHAANTLRYAVTPDTRVLRLVSPIWRPAACREDALDRRNLGVCVLGVTVDGRGLRLDGPNLAGGFHPVEQTAGGPVRWTDGNAVLVLPQGTREVLLRLSDEVSGQLARAPAQRRAAGPKS